ncbi:4Fe-4S ferredoxin-type, iron-sulphur binding domain protein [Acididesulfobacillus acetoxydans]|uniref:4Fe-4S ferredoxin, iron-sulfur binding protein n=1 Tax=Acididesulfobacillus acetoxydans TaxID=1561005 RepID=A0A8S0W3I9_9FIRM|nr:4Fe-4S dicluster domain-containing protein [Acididesulfobacillus acetoxydans]CAA7601738.1 4Fe-4S ferredoxin-type, iron-sulphur binding domain protein [Acididesulfobacillus acetoxydans]CEJ09043.1 4Fe-4S ferredoxin, iron-sulfur binding protein [Acididesulfobacillus acetoxydans]
MSMLVNGMDVYACYQCGKCSASCPVYFAMDILPHQILRLLQIGEMDQVLDCESIWLCTLCSACSTRCPRGVDLPVIIEELRRAGLRRVSGPGRSQRAFHNSVLRSLERHGRVYKAGLAVSGHLSTGSRQRDARLVLALLKRGKLRMWPSRIRGRLVVRGFFQRVQAGQEGEKDV